MPLIQVDNCWSGNDNYSKRFTVISKGEGYGSRIVIPYKDQEGWTRAHASKALDQIQAATGCKRNSIKYE